MHTRELLSVPSTISLSASIFSLPVSAQSIALRSTVHPPETSASTTFSSSSFDASDKKTYPSEIDAEDRDLVLRAVADDVEHRAVAAERDEHVAYLARLGEITRRVRAAVAVKVAALDAALGENAAKTLGDHAVRIFVIVGVNAYFHTKVLYNTAQNYSTIFA